MILKAFPLLAEALSKSENKDILDFNNPQETCQLLQLCEDLSYQEML
jgi:hypothetical protein